MIKSFSYQEYDFDNKTRLTDDNWGFQIKKANSSIHGVILTCCSPLNFFNYELKVEFDDWFESGLTTTLLDLFNDCINNGVTFESPFKGNEEMKIHWFNKVRMFIKDYGA
jgi:hypothetical protein